MNHLSDAERQAHAAGEFDEAAAMRRAGSQAGGDLERALAEIEDWHRYAIDLSVDRDARATATLNLGGVMLDHWPTIRAALDRERELREALQEYGQHKAGCAAGLPMPADEEGPMPNPYTCTCGLEALLAQPAAGEEEG